MDLRGMVVSTLSTAAGKGRGTCLDEHSVATAKAKNLEGRKGRRMGMLSFHTRASED